MIKKSERDSGPPPVLGANLGIPLFQYISALSGIGSCHQYDCLHIRDNRIDISLKALDFTGFLPFNIFPHSFSKFTFFVCGNMSMFTTNTRYCVSYFSPLLHTRLINTTVSTSIMCVGYYLYNLLIFPRTF